MKNLNQTQTCQPLSDLHFKVLDCPLVEISPLAGRWKVKLDFTESVSGKLGSGNTCSGSVDGLRDSHRARGNGAGGRRTWGKLGDWLTRRQGGKIVFLLVQLPVKRSCSLFSAESGAVPADALAPRRLVQHLQEKSAGNKSPHLFF